MKWGYIILCIGVGILISCQKEKRRQTGAKLEAYSADSILQIIITNIGGDTLTFNDRFKKQTEGNGEIWEPVTTERPDDETIYYRLLPEAKAYLDYKLDTAYIRSRKIKMDVVTSGNDTCSVMATVNTDFDIICMDMEVIPLYQVAMFANIHNYYHWNTRIDNRTGKTAFLSHGLQISYHPLPDKEKRTDGTGSREEIYERIREKDWEILFSQARDPGARIKGHCTGDYSGTPIFINNKCRKGVYRIRTAMHFEGDGKDTLLTAFLELDNEIEIDSSGRRIVTIEPEKEEELHFIEHNGWIWNTDFPDYSKRKKGI